MADFVERVVRVDDEPVDEVGDRLGHFVLPTSVATGSFAPAPLNLCNDNRCSAAASGTKVAGINARGSSEIASVDGDTDSSRTSGRRRGEANPECDDEINEAKDVEPHHAAADHAASKLACDEHRLDPYRDITQSGR